MNQTILLAIGHEEFSKHIKGELGNSFSIIDQEVYHQKYIEESIDHHKPDILICHEKYLRCDVNTEEEKIEIWIDLIDHIRKKHDDVRIVMLCERPQGHPFLKLLIAQNVLDIFNDRIIVLAKVKEQLLEKARYKNVNHLKIDSTEEILKSRNVEIEELQDLLESAKTEEEKKQLEQDINKKTNELKNIVESLNDKYSLINVSNERTSEQKKEKPAKTTEKQILKQEIKLQAHKTVTEIVGVMVKPKVIIVGGVDRRVGTSFFSHLLTATINKFDVEVGYIENPYTHAYTYDRYFGELNAPNYISPFSKRNSNVDSYLLNDLESVWKTDYINWIVRNPNIEDKYDEEDFTSIDFAKTLLYLNTPIKVVDIGCDWNREAFRDLFDLADHIFIVTDMDLITADRFFSNDDTLSLLDSFDDRKHIIINKTTKRLEQNNLLSDLPFTRTYLPRIDPEIVYEAQERGELVTNNRLISKTTKSKLQPIIETILPNELIKKKNKKRGIIPKIKIEKA